jgi:hypothetical protein
MAAARANMAKSKRLQQAFQISECDAAASL